jgi:hypothetical protein
MVIASFRGERDMTLYVNTIEFDGRKAVINSYAKAYCEAHSTMRARMVEQRKFWARDYPRATVRTEEMDEAECRRLVALEGQFAYWTIAQASRA